MMADYKATIWVDLDNSPHIPFFAPIIRELERRGYRLWVTASGRYQVDELAAMHGIEHVTVKGGFYGKNKLLKSVGILQRASLLVEAMERQKPDLAISHGSRAQMVAANMTGIPLAVIIDYEFARFPFLHVDWVITPDVIPDSPVSGCGCFCKYHGLKEDVYVPEFVPKGSLVDDFGIDSRKVIATIRPPATEAHYHNEESVQLLRRVVERISADEDAVMVMLPRNKHQEQAIKEQWASLIQCQKLIIPDNALSGLGLIWESDLVISGGGTMNREAAALGVPVYSIFRGEIGAVDHYLCEAGRMQLLRSEEDVDRVLLLQKRERHAFGRPAGKTALHEIADHLEGMALNATLGADPRYSGASRIWKGLLACLACLA